LKQRRRRRRRKIWVSNVIEIGHKAQRFADSLHEKNKKMPKNKRNRYFSQDPW
jgi:hypothetical protein